LYKIVNGQVLQTLYQSLIEAHMGKYVSIRSQKTIFVTVKKL